MLLVGSGIRHQSQFPQIKIFGSVSGIFDCLMLLLEMCILLYVCVFEPMQYHTLRLLSYQQKYGLLQTHSISFINVKLIFFETNLTQKDIEWQIFI